MKKVYFIISAFNEEENIPLLIKEVHQNISQNIEYELVFVNDGSRDRTLDVLIREQQTIRNITIINQNRNFGHEIAMTAGLNYVVSENSETSRDFAVIFMDADLQHPPKIASEMIDLWLQGDKLVLTQRTDNEDKGLRYKIMGNTYYWLLNFLSDVKIPRNMPDFRLLDKKYVLWINQLNESDRMFRGMLSLVGIRDAKIINFVAPQRHAGRSKYNFLKLYKLAIDSVLQFSVKPLRIATIFGFLGILCSFLFLGFSIYNSLVNHEPKTGFLTLLSIMIFLSSVTILFMGIIGEYIGRIHLEVKNRPLYFNEVIKDEQTTNS